MAGTRPRRKVASTRRSKRKQRFNHGYDAEKMIPQATLLAGQDWTDAEIARFFQISERTLYRWKADYPDFARAMVRGEEQMARIVERKLFDRAVGVEVPAVKIMQHEGKPVVHEYDEFLPPNVQAQELFLMAHKPHQYRKRLEHSGDPGAPVRFVIDGFDRTPEEPKRQEKKVYGNRPKNS